MSLFDNQPSRFTEKIDVLDLLINLLREHEEKLDKLVTRLEVMGLNSESIEKLMSLIEASDEDLDLSEYLHREGVELNPR